VLEQVLTRYIEAIIFQAVAENMSSEQSARMVAMKSASDNAETLIDELTLVYNKNRQAGITKEISESSAAQRRYNRAMCAAFLPSSLEEGCLRSSGVVLCADHHPRLRRTPPQTRRETEFGTCS